jgi:hypothetical protein
MPPVRSFEFVPPGFFAVMGTPLVAGRDFTWNDIASRRPVVIISSNLAREWWHEPAAALGKRVREHPRSPWREVIGVVGDVYAEGVDKPAPATAYWPVLLEQFWGNRTYSPESVTFVVRSDRAGMAELAAEMRAHVAAVGAYMPARQARTMADVYVKSLARPTFALAMLGVAAATALLLALVGVYAVISYTVACRRREIGIRMALGAQRLSLTRTLVGRSLLLVGIGVVCGLAAAIPLSRLMRSLLFGVAPSDAATYVAVAAALLTAAALASYLPARRSTAIDPLEALRTEL